MISVGGVDGREDAGAVVVGAGADDGADAALDARALHGGDELRADAHAAPRSVDIEMRDRATAIPRADVQRRDANNALRVHSDHGEGAVGELRPLHFIATLDGRRRPLLVQIEARRAAVHDKDTLRVVREIQQRDRRAVRGRIEGPQLRRLPRQHFPSAFWR